MKLSQSQCLEMGAALGFALGRMPCSDVSRLNKVFVGIRDSLIPCHRFVNDYINGDDEHRQTNQYKVEYEIASLEATLDDFSARENELIDLLLASGAVEALRLNWQGYTQLALDEELRDGFLEFEERWVQSAMPGVGVSTLLASPEIATATSIPNPTEELLKKIKKPGIGLIIIGLVKEALSAVGQTVAGPKERAVVKIIEEVITIVQSYILLTTNATAAIVGGFLGWLYAIVSIIVSSVFKITAVIRLAREIEVVMDP